MKTVDAVTGAFGNTGREIARRLLARGRGVRNFTGHPKRAHALGDGVESFPFSFDDRPRLVETLRGVDTLYNTYWVRFDHGDQTYERAVSDLFALVDAAAEAGVRRMVHVSITNPSEDSPFRYFKGKARVERHIRESGLAHSILRPAVLFGASAILVNNIAWLLRRFPVFAIPGDGRYRLRPIHVEDLADLAVAEASAEESRVLDAVGPEEFAYEDLVRMIAKTLGLRRAFVKLPRGALVAAAGVLGPLVGDVLLTPEEVDGLMADLLHSDAPSTGRRSLTGWIESERDGLGVRYLSELKLHFASGETA